MDIEDVIKPIENHLIEFDKFFKEALKSKVLMLNLIIKHITKRKGKRIRPSLVMLSAGLCGDINARTHTGATLVELLHTATLVHDDVVDESTERRGIATINASWNNKIAVLIGDFLLAKGLLTSIENNEFGFLHAVAKAVRRMSEGELLQTQKARLSKFDEETYFKIISDKTASLMSTCCEIGALSATSDVEIHRKMEDFGENIGIAFQIRDDIFDFLGNSKLIGKPVGNDLKEKKITLPLIHALSNSSSKEGKAILSLIKKGNLTKKNIQYISEFVVNNNGIDYSYEKANEYCNKAVQQLLDFEDSIYKESLLKLTSYIIERKY